MIYVENISVGMFSLKMSTISIFVQKNSKQNCIPKFDIFHKKIQWLSYFEKKIVDFKSQQISLINFEQNGSCDQKCYMSKTSKI